MNFNCCRMIWVSVSFGWWCEWGRFCVWNASVYLNSNVKYVVLYQRIFATPKREKNRNKSNFTLFFLLVYCCDESFFAHSFDWCELYLCHSAIFRSFSLGWLFQWYYRNIMFSLCLFWFSDHCFGLCWQCLCSDMAKQMMKYEYWINEYDNSVVIFSIICKSISSFRISV